MTGSKLTITISGASGAGKTCMMHELACFLMDREFDVQLVDEGWEREPDIEKGFGDVIPGTQVCIMTELKEGRR
jgi:hypothetical protein